MAEEIFYQDFKIIAESYRNEEGKWVPQARVVFCPETMNVEGEPLVWPKELKNLPGNESDFGSAHCDEGFEAIVEEAPLAWPELFDTQLEADDFALESAQLYLDEEYY